ncbi:MAG: hypothetical protein PUA56_02585 [Bacillales bacterium]|nr:hypothetical protein [Bacillales bacterium]
MGYDLKVFNNGKEIDFLASKDNKTFYIYNREIGAFKYLDNLNQKILITNDIIDYSTSTIKHIKLEDFLMMKEL